MLLFTYQQSSVQLESSVPPIRYLEIWGVLQERMWLYACKQPTSQFSCLDVHKMVLIRDFRCNMTINIQIGFVQSQFDDRGILLIHYFQNVNVLHIEMFVVKFEFTWYHILALSWSGFEAISPKLCSKSWAVGPLGTFTIICDFHGTKSTIPYIFPWNDLIIICRNFRIFWAINRGHRSTFSTTLL